VLLPTDTVYGLCAEALHEEPIRRMYRLKGRPDGEPTALVAASVDDLLELVPELRGRSGVIARTLLPGPFTLVLPNPGERFRWLTGIRTDRIGVRVPNLPDDARRAVEAVSAIAATSANEPGGPDPASLEDVPQRLREGCAGEVDAGPLPGISSTVIDFTEEEPRVRREGAASSAEAIARVREALST
jgi:L-threonylcarbamoyladenylate synthase